MIEEMKKIAEQLGDDLDNRLVSVVNLSILVAKGILTLEEAKEIHDYFKI